MNPSFLVPSIGAEPGYLFIHNTVLSAHDRGDDGGNNIVSKLRCMRSDARRQAVRHDSYLQVTMLRILR